MNPGRIQSPERPDKFQNHLSWTKCLIGISRILPFFLLKKVWSRVFKTHGHPSKYRESRKMNKFQRFLLAFAQLGIFSPGFFLMAADDTEEQEALENAEVELTLPEILLDSKGNNVSSDTLAGKYVGLYFSASWCGPCRAFTPSLIKFRNKHGAEFEVVLVGADGSSRAQANYMRKYKMPVAPFSS